MVGGKTDKKCIKIHRINIYMFVCMVYGELGEEIKL